MSDDLMCSTYTDGGIIRFNPAFASVLEYSPQEMVGKMFVDFVDVADRPAVRATFYGLSQFEDAPPSVTMDCRMLTASGDIRLTHWTVRLAGSAFYFRSAGAGSHGPLALGSGCDQYRMVVRAV
jgi:PAS domain S-box-containing protein